MFWRKKEPEDYIAKKNYRKAISIYRERVQQQPENSALRLNLADTLLMDRQSENALKEYKKIADNYTDQGFLTKAIAIYKKMLKVRPEFTEIENVLANLSERVAEQTSEVGAAPAKQEQPSRPAPAREIENKLWRNLRTEEFQRMLSKLKLRHFEEDTIVIKEGDPGDSLFAVIRGEVRVLTRSTPDGKEVVLANLGEGDFFGEISLLTGKPRTATIITNTVSELLELTRKDYENIVQKYPHVKDVMEDFHLQRAHRTVEAFIQALHEKKSDPAKLS